MLMTQVISDKKWGRELSREQIAFFVSGAADGSIKDYQLTALLMAIRLNGMTARELGDLTLAMAHSGDMVDLSAVDGVCVDKHSTGGVGDTTTLVLVPLVAACGAKVVKISGRGLAHTGGTVDKMESIPGMRTSLSGQEMIAQVRRIGCAVAGQSPNMVPADKTLYALRDVTSTVDSIPLIASSIMSKKIAGGAGGIVLDVKTGSGAIIPDMAGSIELAKTMVSIGAHTGRKVIALVTGMSQPLGTHIGNALEVKEAVDILSGRAAGDLRTVSLKLGSYMLLAAGITQTPQAGEQMLLKALKSGAGLQKLKEMIAAQGGDERVCDDTALLPQAAFVKTYACGDNGFVGEMNAEKLGLCAMALGAGRREKTDPIDPAVGFVLHGRVGDKLQKGDPLFTVHASCEKAMEEAAQTLYGLIPITRERVEPEKLIHAIITEDGVDRL